MPNVTLALAFAAVWTLSGCKKTGDGQYEVQKPVVGTETDTVNTPTVETGTVKDTVTVPKVESEKKEVTVPKVGSRSPISSRSPVRPLQNPAIYCRHRGGHTVSAESAFQLEFLCHG